MPRQRGYRGVHKRGKRFRAYITFEGERRYLGTFDTAKEAALQYDAVARTLYGGFAKTNFPEKK